jgi:tRNA A37 threonylcarbamoyladenosine modification protein TsaB
VVDARRGLLFSASFVATGDGLQRVGDEELGAPEELLRHLQTTTAGGRRCLCVGDGARRYAAALAEVPGAEVAGPAMAHPDAAVLAMVGDERRAAGTAVAGEEVAARYLREADVRINWEQRMAPRPVGG